MVVPTTLTIVILTALASWNSYLWPSLILGSRSEYELISTWLFKAGLNPDDPDSNQAVFTNIKMAAAMVHYSTIIYFLLSI
ncbi:hypothetical protein [Mycoplasmopsis felis]|uniref:hypothetical protein n=1 Tax=Mycoplasmopsis felis TaxID=33923 RepID=UPI002FF3A279